jgi:hypothetical protein
VDVGSEAQEEEDMLVTFRETGQSVGSVAVVGVRLLRSVERLEVSRATVLLLVNGRSEAQ